MKFDEIPKLVFWNPNGCTLDLDEVQSTLGRFEKSYGLNLDPDFQRGHVWTDQQRTKYMEYLLRGGKSAPILFNSPVFGGNNHAKNSDLSEEIVIVDGKQRITSCLMFVENKVSVFGGHFLKDFEDQDRVLRSVQLHYVVNKLQTRKDLLQWYLEMNEGHIAHTPEELDRVRKLLSEEIMNEEEYAKWFSDAHTVLSVCEEDCEDCGVITCEWRHD